MATLLRGKNCGPVKLIQFCNDWFHVELPGGKSKIVSPGAIQLDEKERERVRGSDTGMMFGLYVMTADGRFVRRAQLRCKAGRVLVESKR